MKISLGQPVRGIFSYLNDIQKLNEMKSTVKTVDEFSNIEHLRTCLQIRASLILEDIIKKLAVKDVKKKTLINDLYAQDLLQFSRVHHIYMSFEIVTRVIADKQFKCPNIKPLLSLLAKIFALKQLSLDSSALYETGYFNKGSKSLLFDSTKKLLIELRPHMIPLVEL